MALTTAMAVMGSAVVGGIGSAASGRSQRKAQDKASKQQAAEAEKDRQLQREMAQKQQERIDKSVASWNKYDFGAKPLMLRQQPATTAQPSAPTQPTPGMQESMMDRPSTNPLLQRGFR